MELTRWQRIRTRAFLFSAGMRRRMTVGCRAILIDRDDRLYLIRHTYLPGWQFPGGGVEPGESAMQSAAREALEETGYRVSGKGQLLGLYHQTNETTNRDHVAVYIWRQFEKAYDFKANLEIAEFGWFSRDSLPETTTPATHRRIAEIFDGAEIPERW